MRVLVWVIAVAAALWSLPLRAESRLALVIGNAAYTSSPALANPANDAADLARALEATGFRVITGLDLDKRAFDLKLREFSRALGTVDVAVVFYAGHAVQVGATNYLIPIDARLESERDLEFETVRLDLVLSQMELGREKKTSIVFLDACRDNPFIGVLARSMGTRSAGVSRGLAEVKTGVGSFIAYATKPGEVALDGRGRNSPFTSALLRNLPTAGRNLNGLMIEVRKDVLEATGGRQLPWDHSALTGDFFFVAGKAEVVGERDVASIARLAVLKERRRDVEREYESARKRLSDTMMRQVQERDPERRRQMTQDVFAAQRAQGDAGGRLRETTAEIAALEERLAAQPTVPKSGTVTASAPLTVAALPAPAAPGVKTRSFAGFTPDKREGDADLYPATRARGTPLDVLNLQRRSECAEACAAARTCAGYAWQAGSGRCETFVELDALVAETGWDMGVRGE